MSDLSHAIEQMEWLVERDFAERFGVSGHSGREPPYANHWWEHPSRRKDIARIRSYIAAIRILRAATPPATGAEKGE